MFSPGGFRKGSRAVETCAACLACREPPRKTNPSRLRQKVVRQRLNQNHSLHRSTNTHRERDTHTHTHSLQWIRKAWSELSVRTRSLHQKLQVQELREWANQILRVPMGSLVLVVLSAVLVFRVSKERKMTNPTFPDTPCPLILECNELHIVTWCLEFSQTNYCSHVSRSWKSVGSVILAW